MKMKFILSLSLLALVLGSCGSSNEVVGGGIFQKRKYNKGFYWNRNSNLKDASSKNENESADQSVFTAGNSSKSEASQNNVESNYSAISNEKSATSEINVNDAIQTNETGVLSVIDDENQSGTGALIKNTVSKNSDESKFTQKLKKHSTPRSDNNLGNILFLILLIILVILLFTLLDSILGGLLSYILGILILILIIYLILRLLGVV